MVAEDEAGDDTMTRRQKNFLRRLAELIEQHDASLTYTTDDDGIHIEVDGVLVFVGFLSCNAKRAANALREEAK